MLKGKLLLSLVLTTTWVYGWFTPIKAVVKNNSSQMVSLFSQISGPTVNRYSKGPGWCYDSWPVVNLMPNSEIAVNIWFFLEDQAKLTVSVLFSEDEDMMPGGDTTISYFKSQSNMYVGNIEFHYQRSSGLNSVHSGNLECSLTEGGGEYFAQIVVY